MAQTATTYNIDYLPDGVRFAGLVFMVIVSLRLGGGLLTGLVSLGLIRSGLLRTKLRNFLTFYRIGLILIVRGPAGAGGMI